MFCYVDRYFVILFCLLHFLFKRDLVLVSEYDLLHRNMYTQMIYIILYTHTYVYVYVYIYMYVCTYVR